MLVFPGSLLHDRRVLGPGRAAPRILRRRVRDMLRLWVTENSHRRIFFAWKNVFSSLWDLLRESRRQGRLLPQRGLPGGGGGDKLLQLWAKGAAANEHDPLTILHIQKLFRWPHVSLFLFQFQIEEEPPHSIKISCSFSNSLPPRVFEQSFVLVLPGDRPRRVPGAPGLPGLPHGRPLDGGLPVRAVLRRQDGHLRGAEQARAQRGEPGLRGHDGPAQLSRLFWFEFFLKFLSSLGINKSMFP